jgi:hypothetical protein
LKVVVYGRIARTHINLSPFFFLTTHFRHRLFTLWLAHTRILQQRLPFLLLRFLHKCLRNENSFFNVFRLKHIYICVYVWVAISNCRLKCKEKAMRKSFKRFALTFSLPLPLFQSSFKHISVPLPIFNDDRSTRWCCCWDNRQAFNFSSSIALCYSDSVSLLSLSLSIFFKSEK